MTDRRTTIVILAIACCCLLWHHATAFSPLPAAQQHARLPARIQQEDSRSASSLLLSTTMEQRQQQASTMRVQSKLPARTSTSLSMVAQPTVAIAAITGALTAGFVSGGLHAIAGPDHLAALVPRCCGQRWYKAGRVGALWGMGHGVSATLLGVVAFAFKSSLQNSARFNIGNTKILSSLGQMTELAVGLSLLLIGAMGLREAREWKEEIATPPPQSLSAAAQVDQGGFKTAQKRAVVFNGILHGFSWDGAPSLAPAIAVATWSGNLAFLSAYALGTMSTMALATTLIGEGTRRAGEVFRRPDIPQKLSFFSSILAMGIGAVWCVLAITKHGA